MVTVRRGNVILNVSDEQKQEYINKGYDVISDNGLTVLERTVPSDINVLKKAYVDNAKEIKELKAKLAETTNESDSDLQADYNALMNDFNEAMEEIEQLRAVIAEYEAEENSVAEEEKPAKSKKSNKK